MKYFLHLDFRAEAVEESAFPSQLHLSIIFLSLYLYYGAESEANYTQVRPNNYSTNTWANTRVICHGRAVEDNIVHVRL